MSLSDKGLVGAGFLEPFSAGVTTVFHWLLASDVVPQPGRVRGIWTSDGIWSAAGIWYF
jgi:hypothetical protein